VVEAAAAEVKEAGNNTNRRKKWRQTTASMLVVHWVRIYRDKLAFRLASRHNKRVVARCSGDIGPIQMF